MSVSLVRTAGQALPQARKAERCLNKRQFEELFEAAPFGWAILSKSNRFVRANAAFCKLMNYSEQELSERTVWEIAYPEAGQDKNHLEKAIKGKVKSVEFLQRFVSKDNRVVWMNLWLSAVHNRKGEWSGANLIENIPKDRLSKFIFDFSKRMLRSQELEHRWVARELHDGVNQILSSLKFRLESIRYKAEHPVKNHLSLLLKELAKSRALLEIAVMEVRRISQRLRPMVLDDLGLVPAVRSLCDDYRERQGLDIEFSVFGFGIPLPNEIEVTLFRILQEAMNNIEKHSGATKVAIELFNHGFEVSMRIKDNGRGFDPAERTHLERSGLGLIHIRERAMFVDGSVNIHSAPNQGTKISVRIPLKRRASDKPIVK